MKRRKGLEKKISGETHSNEQNRSITIVKKIHAVLCGKKEF
jgi:hypothetical protein